jgi:hypothetical protein
MDALLGGPIPAETHATCKSCAMAAPPGESAGEEHYFNPATKCCTYFPDLPNFLVGRILADEDPATAAGRARVEAGLESVSCTPHGLHPAAARSLLYRAGGDAGFGRARALRCPYYQEEEGGLCGIWQHRRSTCVTWFCKHVRGAVGLRFWQALYALLAAVEEQLAGWCIVELDPGSEALRRCFASSGDRNEPPLDAAQLDDVADAAGRRALWGRWYGREREYFQQCGERVAALGWEQVLAISRPDITAFAQLARLAYAELLSDEIPERLQAGSVQLIQFDAQRCRAVTYSGYDPLELPRRLLDTLPYFDGRPVGASLRAVEDEERLRLRPALVRKLVDFEILAPAESTHRLVARARRATCTRAGRAPIRDRPA